MRLDEVYHTDETETITHVQHVPRGTFFRIHECDQIPLLEFMDNQLNGVFAISTSHGRRWDKLNGFWVNQRLENKQLDHPADLDYGNLPSNIRHAVRLKMMGYNYTEIGKKVNRHPGTISRWLTGRGKEYYHAMQAEADRMAVEMVSTMPIQDIPELHPTRIRQVAKEQRRLK